MAIPIKRAACRLIVLLLGISVGLVCGVAEVRGAQQEYDVKAGFLPILAQFIDWPPEAFADAVAPLVIGVLGDDPFGSALDKAAEQEGLAHNRKLIVRRFRKLGDVKSCHVLFISNSEEDSFAQIFAALRAQSVLTVGETDQFVRLGGIIGFKMRSRNVRLVINPDAARQARLHIHPDLLDLAEIVLGVKKAEEP